MSAAIALLGSVWGQSASILGSWRGTSTCVDRQHFPACNDEQVIYDITLRPGSRDTVTVKAYKLVNGSREFMGESDHGQDADGAWVSDVSTARYHLRIVLRVSGTRMSGTLTDLGAGRQVRAMALERIDGRAR